MINSDQCCFPTVAIFPMEFTQNVMFLVGLPSRGHKCHSYSKEMPQMFPGLGKAVVKLDYGCQNLDRPGRNV